MKQRLIYILLLSAAFVSCSKEPLPQEPPLPEAGQQEVKFNLSIREGGKVIPLAQSRSIPGTLADGFRLMGFLTDKPDAQSNTCEYLFGNNSQDNFWATINTDGTYDGAKRYWKKDGTTYHTFWAYTQGKGHSIYQYNQGGTAGIWNVKHTMGSDPAEQGDLLMASTPDIRVEDGTPAPTVNLEFYHATARLMFRVYGSGGAPVDNIQSSITYALRVRTGERGNLMYRGKPLTYEWWITETNEGPYTLTAPFALPGTANSFVTAVEVGDLLMIPQTTTDGWLTFTLTYTPPGKTNPVSSSIKLPVMTLEAEKQYNVTLNLIAESQTLTLSQVTLTDWGVTEPGTVDPW